MKNLEFPTCPVCGAAGDEQLNGHCDEVCLTASAVKHALRNDATLTKKEIVNRIYKTGDYSDYVDLAANVEMALGRLEDLALLDHFLDHEGEIYSLNPVSMSHDKLKDWIAVHSLLTEVFNTLDSLHDKTSDSGEESFFVAGNVTKDLMDRILAAITPKE
jgi:hypothetical protein